MTDRGDNIYGAYRRAYFGLWEASYGDNFVGLGVFGRFLVSFSAF